MTSRTGSVRRILGILKKVSGVVTWHRTRRVELISASGEGGWLSLARGSLGQVSHEMGAGGCWADDKARIERMCIALLMSKNLYTLKVIKSFVPELRSHKWFSCSKIPMFYIYIYIYIFHEAVSGNGTYLQNVFTHHIFVKVKFGIK